MKNVTGTTEPNGTATVTVRPEANSGSASYDILIGRGLLPSLGNHLGSSVAKILIVHPAALETQVNVLRESLLDRYEVLLAEVPDAEDAKRVEVAAFCWQIMGQTDFTRTDAVIGFGGGATTDLAGFVAATWLRGVKLIQVPTSVLGMVDASVGGKTGINTAEGKNLVGAFYSPAAVLVDLDTLASLPRNEILAGFAEIVKVGFIAEPEILEIIETDVEKATDPRSDEFRRLLELSISMKANVVSQDFTENGLREILNYGHTLGHAIEHAERYRWRHGAAISVGMVFAAELARITGSLSDEIVDRHRRILSSLTLPIDYPLGRWKTLLATMQRDKKARAGMLRFIVLDDLARPNTLNGVEEAILFAAYQEVGV